MRLSEGLLAEFDQEMAATRKVLERAPDDKLDWQPHPKSMSIVALATHIANLPQWTVSTIAEDRFDMAPADGEAPRAQPADSVADALRTFDRNVAAARTAIGSAADDHLLAPWTLLKGGETMFTMPRIAVLRSFVVSHIIHHRAQLGVYLRLNDIPVPAVYGQSADESG